ncbi:hypothetical protein A6B43_00235 [Vespertiliibacter pulmonis]|uniref:Uncharacterized protein n=1 Tax=Vespertiliibacter pulmonis TaxID=1443036 RepID=A0A3N4VSN4_9PAST|nr:hypothetical protein [Vespertiliibacter pulmonis]QLB20074.1 hypothetical protein A6B43_00235 [Vespertiliibacter pulmonis]RPE86038.1 hypothetical protein EDC46_0429 [Vespertiliibacter pulmonis]
MKLSELPLWVQMCLPNYPDDELRELRFELSQNEHLKTVLEQFLHSQWCYWNSKARTELNEEMRKEYQHSAHTIAELTGLIFRPDKPQQTTESLPFV